MLFLFPLRWIIVIIGAGSVNGSPIPSFCGLFYLSISKEVKNMKYGSKKSNIVIAILLFIIAAVFFCYGIYMVNYSMEYIRMYMNISTITFEDALQYVISSSSSYIGFAILMFAGGFIIFSLRKRYPAAAAITDDDSDNDDSDDHDEYDDDDRDDDKYGYYKDDTDVKDYTEDTSTTREMPKSRPVDTPVPEDRASKTEDRAPEVEVTDADAPLKDENIEDKKIEDDKTGADIDEPAPSEEPADKSPEPEKPFEKRSAEKRPAAPATMNEAPAAPKGSSIEASADIPVETFTRPEPAAPKRNVTYKDVVITQSAPRESRPAVDTIISNPELTSDSWVKDFLMSH